MKLQVELLLCSSEAQTRCSTLIVEGVNPYVTPGSVCIYLSDP